MEATRRSRVSSQSGFDDIGIMLQYADRQDYAEHEGWRYLVKMRNYINVNKKWYDLKPDLHGLMIMRTFPAC